MCARQRLSYLDMKERGRHYAVSITSHDDVIKRKHFPRYWPFVWGIHRSPVNSPHKVQWRGASMFSSICAWANGWVNNPYAGNFRRHRAHYYVIVMIIGLTPWWSFVPADMVSSTRNVWLPPTPFPAGWHSQRCPSLQQIRCIYVLGSFIFCYRWSAWAFCHMHLFR